MSSSKNSFSTKSVIYEWIPGQENQKSKGVLILVHGRTGNLRILKWYSKRFGNLPLDYLLIEAPYADQREGQTEPGFSWYLTGREGLQESRKKLDLLVEDLVSAGYSEDSLFFLGFSQGSAMILDLALRSDRVFGGFLCISGLCLASDKIHKNAKLQKIVITHGTRDDIISLEKVSPQYEQLKSLGIPLNFKIFDKPHSFKLNEEVPFLESTLKTWLETL